MPFLEALSRRPSGRAASSCLLPRALLVALLACALPLLGAGCSSGRDDAAAREEGWHATPTVRWLKPGTGISFETGTASDGALDLKWEQGQLVSETGELAALPAGQGTLDAQRLPPAEGYAKRLPVEGTRLAVLRLDRNRFVQLQVEPVREGAEPTAVSLTYLLSRAYPAPEVPESKSSGRVVSALESVTASATAPNAIRELPGFETNVLGGNDDGSTGVVQLGFAANFFGTTYRTLYVNNNGNVTFDSALSTFTPFGLTSTSRVIIAPFFADVDTRIGNPVRYGLDTVNGRPAFGVNWKDVHVFSRLAPTNSFQLILIDRSDIAPGDFDIEFNYNKVTWEAGTASGSNGEGLGGSPARVGYSNGTGRPDTFFELSGSGVTRAFLDSNLQTGLIHNSLNSHEPGRYVFAVRGGRVEREGADLTVAQVVAVSPLSIGGDATFRIAVTNNGGTPAANVVLSDVLPAGLGFVSCNASEGGVCGGEGSTRRVTFATLAPRQTATVTLVARVDPSVAPGTVLSNTVTASSATFDPDPANNTTTASAPARRVDTEPPSTAVALSQPANAAGWHRGDVTVTLSAADGSGRGVRSLTYSASGATQLPATTVQGPGASVVISEEGITTLSFFAEDLSGNVEAVKAIRVRLDRSAPALHCATPEAGWHSSDVLVSCAAGDTGSGLVNVADASFTLATSVPAGTETASASTGSRGLCDRAGNCAVAGPFQGLKVDKTFTAVTVRHAPVLSGGRIEGNVRQLLGESVAYAGLDMIAGDLRVPGTPTVLLGANGGVGEIVEGVGSTEPSGYTLYLDDDTFIGRILTRDDAREAPAVAAPPLPSGTRGVTLSELGQELGDPATLRDLTLTGGAGEVAVPPGTYGHFSVQNGTTLVLGSEGGAQPAVYNLQSLSLAGYAALRVAGPVVVTVAGDVTVDTRSVAGEPLHPGWLGLRLAGGALTVKGGSMLKAAVVAPDSLVRIVDYSVMRGALVADRLEVSGGSTLGAIDTQAPALTIDQPHEGARLAAASVRVTGHFDDLEPTVITVNGVEAALEGNTYSVDVPLTEGPNTLRAVATDVWGNRVVQARGVIRDGSAGSQGLTVDAGPDQALQLPARELALNGGFTGSGALAASWQVVGGPGEVTFSDAASAATLATFTAPGTYVLRLTVGEGEASASDEVSIAVRTGTVLNAPPVVGVGAAQVIQLPAGASLTGTASDDGLPGGSTLATVWSRLAGTGTVTFGNAAALATGATFSSSGVYFLALSATDSDFTSSELAVVTVYPANRPPSANAGADRRIQLPNTASLTGVASDDGLPLGVPLASTWSRVSGPGTVTFENASALATTAAFSEPGTYVLRLTVSDSQYSVVDDLTVTVTPANRAPTVNAGPDRIVAMPATASLAGTVTDDGLPEGGTLTLTWSQVSGPGTTTFSNPNTAATTASFSVAGLYVLRLTASDAAGLTGSDDVTVTVDGVNQAPVAHAGPDLSTMLPQGTVALAGSISDDGLPRGSTLTAAWSQVSGPAPAMFASASAASTSVTFTVAGTYVLRLTASDSALSASDDVTVVVFPVNQAPVVSAGPAQTISLTQAAQLAGAVTDDGLPQGGALTSAWSRVSGPGTVSFADAAQPATSATFSAEGVYVLRLTASDAAGLTGSADVTITVDGINQAPVVSAGPDLSLELPQATVALAGSVTDDGLPRGGSLTASWSQVSGPGTAAFGNASAPSTAVTFGAAGTYVLRLTASDSVLSASDDVTVVVHPANQPPEVSAGPARTVSLSEAAQLAGSVTDDGLPQGGALTSTWSRVSGPGTVTFADASRPATTATFSAVGTYVLRLTASDSRLTVSSDVQVQVRLMSNQAPVVSAGAAQVLDYPQRTATLAGTVTDDGLPEAGTVSSAWSVVQGAGTVTFANPAQPATTATFGGPGTYVLRLTATDGESTAFADVSIQVRGAQGPVPTVSITSPPNGATVTGPVTLAGTVSNGDWRVEYTRGSGEPETQPVWTVIASGTAPASGTLATFDPTLLVNGTYTVRLVGSTETGSMATSIHTVAEGQLKLGEFSLAYKDLSVPLSGLPLDILRTYDTRDLRNGDFGVGWSLSFSDVRLEKSGVLGTAWQQTATGRVFPTYCVVALRPRFVTVTFPTGKVFRFRARSSPECQQLVPIRTTSVTFQAEPGTRGTLALVGDPTALVNAEGGIPGPVTLIDADVEPFNPTLFDLTTDEGTTYRIDEHGGLISIKDRHGGTLTVGSGGLVHSDGQSVLFQRDTAGRITRITDPQGHFLTYTYDARGDLVAVTNREGETSTFTYDGAHRVLTVKDPTGIQPLRNDYDTSGRLVSTTDALGNVMRFSTEVGARREVITDRLGHPTVYEYDVEGNVLKKTDALGNATSYTYDADGNMLTETDPLGRTTTYTYDARGNELTRRDALGNTTTRAYNTSGKVLSFKDARGFESTFQYDANGSQTVARDPAGRESRMTYDARGRQLTLTNMVGATTTVAYDSNGFISREEDSAGQVFTYTNDASGRRLTESYVRTTESGPVTVTTRHEYDREGRRTATFFPDGSVSRVQYDDAGREVVTTDELGRQTRYEYDVLGQRVRTLFPDGTTERTGHDANGRVVSMTDRAGRVTRFTFDAAGRRTRIDYPGGAFKTFGYDAAGRLTAETDETGRITRREYDAAGREVRSIDPDGRVSSRTYDASGNVLTQTDATGRTLVHEYDAMSRRTRTVYPDGSAEGFTYDGEGRRITWTDRAGNTTRYGYDVDGNLVSVTDALGGVTTYTLDALGNRLAQVDASGRVTRFSYDLRGRLVERRLPGGQRELRGYDTAGNLVSRTDAAGRTSTWTYDAMNRPLTQQAPGEPAVHYTYTATGQRSAVEDGSGQTVYTYDVRDRLLTKAVPAGTLTYTYDAAGRVLSLRSDDAAGVAVDYGYDTAGRLSRVTDAVTGDVTTYGYDAAGRLSGYAYANGTRTELAHDSLGRVRQLTLDGTARLASYTYTHDAAGNRASLLELSGRSVTWTYDALHRLTGESSTGAPNASENGGVSYAYDAAGNRVAQLSTLAAVPSTTYVPDANDWLASESYDANGNVLATGGRSYAYDAHGRLRSVDGGAVRYGYDADGHLVSRGVGAVTAHYLVDERSPTGMPQVVEERVAGQPARVYVFGRQLISLRDGDSAASRRFFHFDAQGNVRLLTDGAGTVTDGYTFDAFGVELGRFGTTPNVHRFAGERFDPEASLSYLRARHLDSRTGRFTSSDTFEAAPELPVSLHRYHYAWQNPVNLTDPSGHFPLIHIIRGQEVHTWLGIHFMAAGLLIGHWRLSDVTLGSLVDLLGGTLSDRKRPDLTDLTTEEIWEIKPNNARQISAGRRQLSYYVGTMGTATGGGWREGNAVSYPTPASIPLSDGSSASISYHNPAGGLIVYDIPNINPAPELFLGSLLAMIYASQQINFAQLQAQMSLSMALRF